MKRATVSVFKKEGGKKLKAGDLLQPYFALPPGSAGLAGPGKGEDTPLFVTFPPNGKYLAKFLGERIDNLFGFGNTLLSPLQSLSSLHFMFDRCHGIADRLFENDLGVAKFLHRHGPIGNGIKIGNFFGFQISNHEQEFGILAAGRLVLVASGVVHSCQELKRFRR